jgi:hypothetical protein
VKRRRSTGKERHSPRSQEQGPRPSRDLTPLSEVLRAVFDDPSLPFNPDDHRIWQVWDDVVGPAISRNARPSWIKDGRLRVRVSGPIWLQELEFAAESIRGRLNEALGRRAVTRIDFRLGNPTNGVRS